MTSHTVASVEYEDLRARITGRVPAEDVVAFLAPLTEQDRARMGRGLLADLDRNEVERATLEHRATFLALLGCATSVRQVMTNVWRLRAEQADVALAVRVLTDRSPSWLGSFAQAATDSDTAHDLWALTRALVRAGSCDRPSGTGYLETLVTAGGDLRGGVLGLLRDDPALLDRELWDVLQEESLGRRLAWADSSTTHRERTWQHALVVLQEPDGEPDGSPSVDRTRLLDAVLDAFLSDRAAVDLRWFVGLHDALSVTDDEVAAQQARYLRGLASEVAAVVRLAQRELGRLLDAGLDVDALLEVSHVALEHQTKGVVQAQRTLLSKVARARPEYDDLVRGLLEGGTAEPVRVQVLEQPLGEMPLPVARRVSPVEDPEELVEAAARALEEPCEIVTLERVLDGVARLAGAGRPAGADALAARAESILEESWPGPWQGCAPGADVAALVLAWLRGARPPEQPRYRNWLAVPYPWRPGPSFVLPRVRPGDSLGVWWSTRVREVADHAARGTPGRPLLALPATEDGAVDVASVLDRLARTSGDAKPLPFDTALAAFRLPDPGDLAALPQHPSGAALAHDVARLRAHVPRWECAEIEVPVDDRDGPRATIVSWWDASGPDARRRGTDALDALLVGREHPQQYPAETPALCTHAWPFMFPHHSDLLAAHGHAPLLRAVRSARFPAPVLAGLGRASRTCPVVTSALVLGMSAKDPAGRLAAVDAVADLAATGGLDGVELGREIGRHVTSGIVVAGRVGRALQDVGRSHARAADAVVDAVETVLPELDRRPDTHRFVAALADSALATARTASLPEELAALAVGRSRSVLAQECRRVPRDEASVQRQNRSGPTPRSVARDAVEPGTAP
ncbi:DUF6493 family protein [Cellulosimicrobium cellulans]|uniref:DUF6493 family protein n=1 Tax=Cellulosimicrobium cellulans TaxID=1710 RepID=UPI0036EDA59A